VNRQRFAVLGLAVFLSASCSDSSESTADPTLEGIYASVVGPALSGLDQNGVFQLTPAAPVSPQEIREGEARDLAIAYVKTFGPFMRAALEKQHGRPIDFQALVVCGRAFYAETPYEPFPDEVADFGTPLRTVYGSWWIFGFCNERGQLQISEAVPAITRARIVDGQLRDLSGTDQFMRGVPQGWDSPVGLSPERAVVRAATRTARKVKAVPRLIASDLQQGIPQSALWRLELDRAASLVRRGTGEAVEAQTVYVGLKSEVSVKNAADSLIRIPMSNEAVERTVSFPIPRPRADGWTDTEWGTVTVSRRAGLPASLDVADPRGRP